MSGLTHEFKFFFLRPLDHETILDSVRKTNRVVIVDEGWKFVSLAAEISSRIMEEAFYGLDTPVQRVCSEEVRFLTLSISKMPAYHKFQKLFKLLKR